MKVKNINGTSANTCKCKSWLAHWTTYGGGVAAPYCSVSSCGNLATVGAHVQKDSESDRSWYIVPMCTTHNAKATELTIRDGTKLVSANVASTCGK